MSTVMIGGSYPMLRTAVIGTGFVGPHHVDAVRRGGFAEVVALAGADAPQLAARSRELGIGRTTENVAELLADPTIDVIHVCTPNNTHVELATAALEAGKHVVVEKPLALEAESANKLVTLAQRQGRHAMVAFTYRGYPMVRRARQLAADGSLGELRLIYGQYLQDWLARASDYNWRLEPAQGGRSRAVADIGMHWFDTVEFVSGLRIESVFAELATFLRYREKPVGDTATFATAAGATERVRVRSEDAAALLVRFDNGALGTCLVSQVSLGHKNDLVVELDGSDRSLSWHQQSPEQLWLGARDSVETLLRDAGPGQIRGVPDLPAGHSEGWGEALRDLLRPFYAAIAAGEPAPAPGSAAPYPTLADGTRAVAFVEAVLASSDSGCWMPIAGGTSSMSSEPIRG
ncbi:MAG: Gfo/Idh/MocA family oxidoreductase [Candidatus Limnocylindrales bacterium]|jgi:predicted dehydrogenase